MKLRRQALSVLTLLAAVVICRLDAQVTYDRLLNAAKEPRNWLTYSGSYASQRYTELTELTPANVTNLEQKWVFQGSVVGAWQSTPLVVDGVMYVTQRQNDVVALDARTGRAFWIFRHSVPADHAACCGANNRGLAILGDTLYLGTLDAHLVAIDARSGRPLWKVKVAEYRDTGYSITLAPLVVKDKVLVGVGGGELGIRGFLAAFDARTGREVWRRYTIPAPGEPGAETWQGDAWKTGGAPIWVTGSYDPVLNLTYWGTGNPGPDWYPAQRPGDNLYSDSVIAVDPDTGEMKWHFQFTPHDAYDFDAVQIPVLVDMDWNGRPAKLMLWANRNGFFYVLDRATGAFLFGKPFVKVNWASGLDERGRPLQTPPADGEPIWPGVQGGTNWYSPSYSPRTGLMYVPTWENYAAIIRRQAVKYEPGGRGFTGGGWKTLTPLPDAPGTPALRRGAFNLWTEATGTGAVIALDPRTGVPVWKFEMTDVTDSGILTTASDLLFTGGREGYFQALDARSGTLLWKTNLGGQIVNGPISYEVDGRQYVATIAGLNLVAFALRE
ncbi:MAG: PQQ-dependent dehydrogenase, methanol/ethanol family [Vicinamibacterales bacterium]